MSAPVLLASKLLANLASASPTTSPALLNGIGILGSGAGLFGHILNLGNVSDISPDGKIAPSLTLASAKVDNKGTSIDLSLLTLSQELSSMPVEELQSLIDRSVLGQVSEEEINVDILKSLTLGIPTREISLDDNVLLSATYVSPTTLSDLKSALKILKESLSPDNETALIKEAKNNNIDKDILELSTDMPNELIMVVFIPAYQEIKNSELTDFEFDPSVFSSLIQVSKPKTSEPSLFDSDIDLYSDTDSELSLINKDPKELDFQGSLGSLKGKKGDNNEDVSNINGKLAVSTASGLMSAFGASFSHFDESSHLLTDANSISINLLSANTNPLFTSSTATGTHPATQFIAKLIEKAATGSDKAKQELSVQLDPPELGRMQIHLSMEKGETMKVRLVAETQETLTLLQRDSHALKSALQSAGIQTDSSSLSFDLSSGNQSFNELLGGNHQDSQSGRSSHFSSNIDGSILNEDQIHFIETKINFIPDVASGNIHYSLLV